jgi:hypothetical protein
MIVWKVNDAQKPLERGMAQSTVLVVMLDPSPHPLPCLYLFFQPELYLYKGFDHDPPSMRETAVKVLAQPMLIPAQHDLSEA